MNKQVTVRVSTSEALAAISGDQLSNLPFITLPGELVEEETEKPATYTYFASDHPARRHESLSVPEPLELGLGVDAYLITANGGRSIEKKLNEIIRYLKSRHG